MRRPQDAHRRINAEIAQEKAAALGRAGERLEAAIARAAELSRRRDAAADLDEQERLLGDSPSHGGPAVSVRSS